MSAPRNFAIGAALVGVFAAVATGPRALPPPQQAGATTPRPVHHDTPPGRAGAAIPSVARHGAAAGLADLASVAPPQFVSLSEVERARIADVLSPEAFDALLPQHRAMLANLARGVAGKNSAAAETPGAEPAVGGPADPPLAGARPGAGGGGAAGLSIDRPFVCFAPGTADVVREAFAAFSADGERARRLVAPAGSGGVTALALQTNGRWSRTATDGFRTGGQGDPITLTWSIVPDGVSIPGNNGEPTAPSDLRAWLDSTYGSEANWLPLFQQVFDRWGELTGIDYVYVSDDGASFPSSRGRLGQRGDVRIAGHPIDGDGNVLAYNFFPDGGDMVIDTADGLLKSTTSNSRRLRNTIAHEHGHGLGLSHVCPLDQTKLMEPNLTSAFDGPQHDDIYSAQRLYGDRFESDGRSADANDLGTLPRGSPSLTRDVSIDDGGDADYFEFRAPGSGYELDIALRPVGFTYLEGPQEGQNCTGTSFDSSARLDLAVELLGGNGSTVLAAADAQGPGAAELITRFPLPGDGPFFVRVTGGTANTLQLYELELEARRPPPELAVDDTAVAEGVGTIEVTVTLSEPNPDATVVCSWSTADGTADSSDYSGGAGFLQIPPGAAGTTITIQCTDDALDEADTETFEVRLAGAQNAVISDGVAEVTIADNDPLPTVAAAFREQAAGEAAAAVAVDFTLDAPSGRAVEFDVATEAGSATPGADFTPLSERVTIPAGATSASRSIALIDDLEAEADETLGVALSAPLHAVVGSGAGSEIVLLDDEARARLASGGGRLEPAAGDAGVEVVWPAVAGRRYRVEESENFVDWMVVPGAEDIVAQGVEVRFLDARPSPDGRRRFYRIVDQTY